MENNNNILRGYISLPIPHRQKPFHFLLFDAGSCAHRWYFKFLVAEKLSNLLLRLTMYFREPADCSQTHALPSFLNQNGTEFQVYRISTI